MTTLHDELTVNGMRMRNRIVLPPLTTNNGSPEGLVTDGVNQFYEERAKDVGSCQASVGNRTVKPPPFPLRRENTAPPRG